MVYKCLAFLTPELLVKLLNHTLEQHKYVLQSFYAFHVHEWMIGTNINQVQAEFQMKYLKLVIIEPIFKRVAICLIFIFQWAIKAWIIANFTIPATYIVRIRIFIPYICLKLKNPKTKVGTFFGNTLKLTWLNLKSVEFYWNYFKLLPKPVFY